MYTSALQDPGYNLPGLREVVKSCFNLYISGTSICGCQNYVPANALGTLLI